MMDHPSFNGSMFVNYSTCGSRWNMWAVFKNLCRAQIFLLVTGFPWWIVIFPIRIHTYIHTYSFDARNKSRNSAIILAQMRENSISLPLPLLVGKQTSVDLKIPHLDFNTEWLEHVLISPTALHMSNPETPPRLGWTAWASRCRPAWPPYGRFWDFVKYRIGFGWENLQWHYLQNSHGQGKHEGDDGGDATSTVQWTHSKEMKWWRACCQLLARHYCHSMGPASVEAANVPEC